MNRIKFDLRMEDDPLPADFFDLIGGTSTGGLIALLLGRLRLSVPQARNAFVKIAKDVFSIQRYLREGRFNEKKLEEAVKGLLRVKFGADRGEERMLDRPDAACKVFVCTVAAKDIGARAGPRLFRTYAVRANRTQNCKIWEASRATSAAPTYFKRISIGPEGEEEEFLDGGLGYNNPVKQVLEEAERIFPADQKIGCIVSIGTGQAKVIKYDTPNLAGRAVPIQLINALKDLATDSDMIAEEMEKKFVNARDTYFRFSVDRGLDGISLEEWEKLQEVGTYTASYVGLTAISSQIDKLAAALLASKRSLDQPGTTALVTVHGCSAEEVGTPARPLELSWPPQQTTPNFQISVAHLAIRPELVTVVNDYGSRAERAECLSALFLTDPAEDRSRFVSDHGERVDGTCTWIRTHPKYLSWLRPGHQLLRIYGGPGKGKTMLSVFLTEQLGNDVSRRQDEILIYYFCNNRDKNRRTAVTILRGLMYQLLQKCPALFKHILPRFQIQKEDLFSDISFEALWRIFQNMISDSCLKTIYCLLDGLDECDKHSLEGFLKKLMSLFSADGVNRLAGNFKIVILCRDVPKCIPQHMTGFPLIDLNQDAEGRTKADIERFITAKVDELALQCLYSPQTRSIVETSFLRGATGTFLWVSLVAKMLEGKANTEVEEILWQLPDGLPEIFQRLLLQIEKGRRKIAAEILRWVALAMRPLTLSELSAATGTEGSAGLSREEVTKERIGFCGYFLEVHSDNVELIHQSAKDFLLRRDRYEDPILEYFRIKQEAAHADIARACLSCVNDGFSSGTFIELNGYADVATAQRLREHPLLAYATLHWPAHARASSSMAACIYDFSLPFYKPESDVRTGWFGTYNSAKGVYRPLQLIPYPLLHIGSYFDLLPLVQMLLGKYPRCKAPFAPVTVNDKDGLGRSALFWASARGNTTIARLLLQEGADQSGTPFGQTPLWVACRYNQIEMVRLLLHTPVEHGQKNTLWQSLTSLREIRWPALLYGNVTRSSPSAKKDRDPFEVASRRGNDAVVRLLVERGYCQKNKS